MTKINKLNFDWKNVRKKCRVTVGKEDIDTPVSDKFKFNLLLSEHSPIRELTVDWSWVGIKSWIATHYSRHKFECYIQSQRTDRTGINRDKLPQDEPVNFDGSANAQQLIDVMRKRLCFKSSPETRALACDLKLTLMSSNEATALGTVLVPNCVYRNGCPEMGSCGFYKQTDKNIEDRYYDYNVNFVKSGGNQ